MISYQFIPEAGDVLILRADLPETPSRQQIKDIVLPLLRCDVLERIVVSQGIRDVDMMIDDIGLLTRRPVNQRATELYHAWHKRRSLTTKSIAMANIYGPVVLFDCQVWF